MLLLEGEAADIVDRFQLRLRPGKLSAIQGPEVISPTIVLAIFRRFQEAASEWELAALSALVAAADAALVDRQYRCECAGKFMNHGFSLVQIWCLKVSLSFY